MEPLNNIVDTEVQLKFFIFLKWALFLSCFSLIYELDLMQDTRYPLYSWRYIWAIPGLIPSVNGPSQPYCLFQLPYCRPGFCWVSRNNADRALGASSGQLSSTKTSKQQRRRTGQRSVMEWSYLGRKNHLMGKGAGGAGRVGLDCEPEAYTSIKANEERSIDLIEVAPLLLGMLSWKRSVLMEVVWKQGKTESRVKYSKSRLRNLKGENDRWLSKLSGEWGLSTHSERRSHSVYAWDVWPQQEYKRLIEKN